jgi:hypothetical protein
MDKVTSRKRKPFINALDSQAGKEKHQKTGDESSNKIVKYPNEHEASGKNDEKVDSGVNEGSGTETMSLMIIGNTHWEVVQ